ncbi:protein translocase subunit SecD [Sporichthya brevicatena]|uniref:Multifunctional fusion protein n=1 Tax=Sporichthya brevicatena TaxID=171442 RepID=A0ABN1H6E0_9ACTN
MRARQIRALISLLVLAGSLFAVFTMDAKLGLDLKGGTQVVLETKDSDEVKANRESTDKALEVLRRRVDALGVAEPSIARSGDRRIIVELPGLQEPAEAAKVLGRTAQLTFHPVLGDGPAAGPGADKPAEGERELVDEDGLPIRIGKAALTGSGVGGADAGYDLTMGGWYVTVDFRGSGEGEWKKLTGTAACNPVGDPTRRIAIVLDQEVISSPQVDPSVGCDVGIGGGSTQITGSFTEDGAKDLSALISGGALPVPVEIIEQRTVGPTLGQAAIDASRNAAIIGIILTGLFIVLVYRFFGFLATIALASYALISFAALLVLGATLTLPGLAGFVLAIGMAIDANVLVFERAREEYEGPARKNLRTAMNTGYNKAWTAIIDSNVTTLLAAGLLFYFASGPVRGFGVTLSIGVIASMVSALIVARSLTELAANRPALRRRAAVTGIASTGRVRDWIVKKNPDLMARRTLWLSISAVLVVVAIAGIVVRGLNLGIEFTGGRLVEYSTSTPLDPEVAREKVSGVGFPRAIVQSSGEDDITVRASDVSNEDELKIREALSEVGGEVTKLRDELIGPSLGKELRNKAIIALVIALLAQMIYLGIRFRWTFGAAAVAAMFHDVLLVTGAFAWFGRPVDGVFLAAALTIVGLSVNDSVVVFDRVREMWADNPKMPFARICNLATLQTVPRTVNTGLGAMFILAALAVLGGDSLMDFAIALLLGLIVGTLSSVFTATPLAILLQARSNTPPPEPRKPRDKRERERTGDGAVI